MKTKLAYPTQVHVLLPQSPKRRRRLFFLLACVVFVVCGSALTTLIVYPSSAATYRQDMSLANDGIQHLQQAETTFKGGAQHLFELKTIDSVQGDF